MTKTNQFHDRTKLEVTRTRLEMTWTRLEVFTTRLEVKRQAGFQVGRATVGIKSQGGSVKFIFFCRPTKSSWETKTGPN